MHLNFGRSSRSDGSATPPAEPVFAAAPEPDVDPEAPLPTDETAAIPVPEPTDAVEPVDVAETTESEPAVVVAIEAWPDEDPDAVPVVAQRRGRNDDPEPVGLTAPTPPSGWTAPMTQPHRPPRRGRP